MKGNTVRRIATFGFLFLTALPAAAPAQETLGVGRIFNNDYLGDGHDRWRTGSYAISVLRGDPGFDPTTGASFGEVLEYRLQTEIVAPSGRIDDRPYVGAISAGVASHFDEGDLHLVLGASVTALGPQTGLAKFQQQFHDRFGLAAPYVANQVADEVRFSARASATYTAQISETFSLRPFVAARTGVEDIFRVGADILIGAVGQNDLWLRDDTTGQPYRGTHGSATGLSYLIGGDVARVGNSALLPTAQGPAAGGQRARARAGVHWQPQPDTSLFYGVTYLSEEFQGQPEGQVVGSLTLNFNF